MFYGYVLEIKVCFILPWDHTLKRGSPTQPVLCTVYYT